MQPQYQPGRAPVPPPQVLGRYHTFMVPAKTPHILHAIATTATLGLWSPIWFTHWIYNHNRTVTKRVWLPD